MDVDEFCMNMAVAHARSALRKGEIPIACVLRSENGLLAVGANQRVAHNSVTRHAEIDALENWGREHIGELRNATLYTTLSPCVMCTGAILWAGIPRVVVGDRKTYEGPTNLLVQEGVQVDFHEASEAYELLRALRETQPDLWKEDNAGN